MKKFALLMFGLATFASSFAQDVIITRDAKKYNAKVTEVGVFVVKYKLASETDGPTYVLPKSKIAAITYQSGRVETYFDDRTMSSDTLPDTLVANNAPVPVASPAPVADTVEAPAPAKDYVFASDSASESVLPYDYERGLLYYEESLKGIRFKIEAAPLFGGHQHFYGFENHTRYNHNNGTYAFDDSTHSISAGLEAAVSVGYQFNSLVYLGVGFDVAAMDKFDWVALSEYLDFNVYCLRYRRTSPIVGLRVGISSLVEPDDRLGYFIEPNVGVCHRFLNPNLAMGATVGYRVTSFDTDDNHCQYNGLYYDGTAVSAYFVKVFFSF